MAKHKDGVKRFGVRYGKTLKTKLADAESSQKTLYECPSCMQKKVKRESAGIWECRKCGLKFAGKAYTVSKKIKIKEEETIGEEHKETKKKRLKRKEDEAEEDEQAEENEEK